MALFVRVGKRLPGGPPEARRDRLEQALVPRASDQGCLSVYRAETLEEARCLAVLHAAHARDSPDNVDFIAIDARGFTSPPVKHEHGAVVMLRDAHHEIPNMDDVTHRIELALRLLAAGAVESHRVRKADAMRIVGELLRAQPMLKGIIGETWRA